MTDYYKEYDITKVIYAIVTVVAIPELIIFGIAYSTTFINVIVNPEKETSRFLAVFNLFMILCIRFMYAVFFLLALPDAYSSSSASTLASIRQVFITFIAGWWILTICVPAFVGLLSWCFNGVGNIKRSSSHIQQLPKFISVLPVYNESVENLVNAINAILDSNYPRELMEIHVSFDDPKLSDLYKSLLSHFVPFVVPEDLPPTFKWVSEDSSIIYFHRWPHGGKRSAQAYTWTFIQKNCNFTTEPIFILTDSDNIMLNEAFNNLAIEFDKQPNKIAFAGYMSCMSNPRKTINFVRMIQDTEYVSNEINRFFELSLGTVNCLPGGFTAIKYSTLEKIAPHYFTELKVTNITQYHQYILGEDRYLTHLVHKMFKGHSVGFSPLARCKTDPPDTAMKYVKQRRRWLLGCIANEAFMLSAPLLWTKFPLLLIFKVIQTSWRSTTFCQLLVLICAVTELINATVQNRMTFVISTCVPLFIAWMAGSIAGFFLGRFKIFFLWPFMLIAQSVWAVMIDFYALYTWKVRSWGGPRFDSASQETNVAEKIAIKIESTLGKPVILVSDSIEPGMQEVVYY